MNWGWPQWVVACYFAGVALFEACRRDQTPGMTALGLFFVAALVWLLYMGGFWS